MKLVTQEGKMGCGVACMASRAGVSYKKMLSLITRGEVKDRTTGFYTKDFKEGLGKLGYEVRGYSIKSWGDKPIPNGTIVFIRRGKVYRPGHFMLKTARGWMDPWKTGTTLEMAKAGWRVRPADKIDWIIEVKKKIKKR